MLNLIPTSLPLFRVCGVSVQAHFSWLLYVAGMLTWSVYDQRSFEAVEAVGFILAMLFGSLLLHEFAHVFIARVLHYPVYRILLLPFACITELEVVPGGWHEICVALAGPMANLAFAAVSLSALPPFWSLRQPLSFLDERSAMHILGSSFCIFNAMIGGINLIPCFPLDGGRIFRSLLTLFIKRTSRGYVGDSYFAATRISIRFVAHPIAVFAVIVCLHYHDWMDLVPISLIILAGYWELSELESSQADDGCSNGNLVAPLDDPGNAAPVPS